jgi:hypothetical protein
LLNIPNTHLILLNTEMRQKKSSRTAVYSVALGVIFILASFAQESKLPGRAPEASKIIPPYQETGYQRIFDGKTLNGWDCDPDFWRVESGAIVGQTTLQHQPKQNTFCIWKGGKPADFDLRLQYRLTGTNDGNSGIQYRSIERPDIA